MSRLLLIRFASTIATRLDSLALLTGSWDAEPLNLNVSLQTIQLMTEVPVLKVSKLGKTRPKQVSSALEPVPGGSTVSFQGASFRLTAVL
ncbi:hypothetical protein AV530_007811 [Patagioenas fasciata monilis]|uniref:Uncharacterized protein n=1 Tax=Patagioenas fasciata monilis TaxID=372326 RepID=A0A1V4JSZ9_PATFA|nr:hypothetical protein AV530_007811 [Patagioenas fasciata monilis]